MDKGRNVDVFVNAASELENHDYFLCTISDYVLCYVTGYIARKGQRFAKFMDNKQSTVCDDCLRTLVLGPTDEIPETHRLILLKTKGGLKHLSAALVNLLSILGQATIKEMKNGEINAYILFSITNIIGILSPLPLVGCGKHENEVTQKIIRFFLTTRMCFLCKQSNANDNIEKEQTRERRKCSKLSQASECNSRNNIMQSSVCSVENAAQSEIKMKPTKIRTKCKEKSNKENICTKIKYQKQHKLHIFNFIYFLLSIFRYKNRIYRFVISIYMLTIN